MRAFLRPLCSVALAIAATSSLAQSVPSPDGNGFFAANPAPDSGFFRPADDPALTAMLRIRPPQDAAELEELERRRQREEIELQQREERQLADFERQGEINWRDSNPANVLLAPPGT